MGLCQQSACSRQGPPGHEWFLRVHASQLYWPDDQKWYLVEIQSVNVKARRAK